MAAINDRDGMKAINDRNDMKQERHEIAERFPVSSVPAPRSHGAIPLLYLLYRILLLNVLDFGPLNACLPLTWSWKRDRHEYVRWEVFRKPQAQPGRTSREFCHQNVLNER
jgi:hypothetical protein